jgi:hypothetical protein
MTLPVQLSCPLLCRRPVFSRAFHCWSRLAVRPRVRAVRPRSKQRWAVKPRDQAVRPPPCNGVHGSGALPASPSGSTEFDRLPGGAEAHDFGYAQCGLSVYDHNRTTHSSRALPASPSGSTVFGCLPGCVGAHDFGYAQCGALDSTRGSRALLTSPLGCARATVTTSTSVVAAGEGCTSGTSGQSTSDDHAGEAGLLADKPPLSASSVSTVSPVPSSIRAALVDPNCAAPWKKSLLP